MIPPAVRVAGLDLPVQVIEGLDGFGVFDPVGRRIEIAAGLDPAVAASTVLHEVLHAVVDAYDLRLDERGIRAIEAGLVGAMRHDPAGARAWLDGLLTGAGPGGWVPQGP